MRPPKDKGVKTDMSEKEQTYKEAEEEFFQWLEANGGGTSGLEDN